jgi:hypothetical protein
VSDHSLEIETGRYKNITREERTCKNCNLNETGMNTINSVDCFRFTSAKSSELAFNKILFFLMAFLQ